MQPQAQFDRIISICKLFLPLCSILGKFATPQAYTYLFRHRSYGAFDFSKSAFQKSEGRAAKTSCYNA